MVQKHWLLLLLVAACSANGAAPGPGLDVSSAPEDRRLPQDFDEVVAGDAGVRLDSRDADVVPPLPDVGIDAPDLAPVDASAGDLTGEDATWDVVPEVHVPLEAGIGDPCQVPEDCAEGLCVEGTAGYFCVPPCADGCPKGWVCVEGGTESWCVPDAPGGCIPCAPENCPAAWCRTLGAEGAWCLRPCAVEPCAPGFSCVVDEPGSAPLCHPDIASCRCTADQVGTQVPCAHENIHGVCPGQAQCTADQGVVGCDAPAPAPDVCDGKDNDCDGTVDEDFPKKGKPCDGPDADECTAGLWACAADGEALVCNEGVSFAEKCDGKDNDCDGLTDEDWPNKGKPCGVSPLCGVGTFVCSPLGYKLVCEGVHPMKEKCDGKDNDCDGLTDEGFADLNGNGVADCLD